MWKWCVERHSPTYRILQSLGVKTALTGHDLEWIQEFREIRLIVMIWILFVLDGAVGWESGESVSLLSRTPKARALRQF